MKYIIWMTISAALAGLGIEYDRLWLSVPAIINVILALVLGTISLAVNGFVS